MRYGTIDTELLRAARATEATGDEIVTMPLTANGTAAVSPQTMGVDPHPTIGVSPYTTYTTAHGHSEVSDAELESLEALVGRIPDTEPHRSHTHAYTYSPQTYTIDYVNEPHITSNTYPYTGSHWEIDPGRYTIKWDQDSSFHIEREPKKQMPLPSRDELMDFLADE